jgi:hypothetical protein
MTLAQSSHRFESGTVHNKNWVVCESCFPGLSRWLSRGSNPALSTNMTLKKFNSRLDFWMARSIWNSEAKKEIIEMKLSFAETKRKKLIKKLNCSLAHQDQSVTLTK